MIIWIQSDAVTLTLPGNVIIAGAFVADPEVVVSPIVYYLILAISRTLF